MRLTILLTFLLLSLSSNAQIIDFESAVLHIQLDTSAGNLWQIGTPQKTVFDAARLQSGTGCQWITCWNVLLPIGNGR